MQSKGNLFILSAPSGAGKSSLIKALLERHSDMQVSVSHTTRAPRPGEENGKHYHFVDKNEFQKLIEQDNFLEWAEVFDKFYGTSAKAIEDQLDAGIDVFLDIDWQGARQIRDKVEKVTTIFILPPSKVELKQRLVGRGQDSEETIAYRMEQAQSEMSHYHEFDYVIINDSFDQALYDLELIVYGQRLAANNQAVKYQNLINELLAK